MCCKQKKSILMFKSLIQTVGVTLKHLPHSRTCWHAHLCSADLAFLNGFITLHNLLHFSSFFPLKFHHFLTHTISLCHKTQVHISQLTHYTSVTHVTTLLILSAVLHNEYNIQAIHVSVHWNKTLIWTQMYPHSYARTHTHKHISMRHRFPWAHCRCGGSWWYRPLAWQFFHTCIFHHTQSHTCMQSHRISSSCKKMHTHIHKSAALKNMLTMLPHTRSSTHTHTPHTQAVLKHAHHIHTHVLKFLQC